MQSITMTKFNTKLHPQKFQTDYTDDKAGCRHGSVSKSWGCENPIVRAEGVKSSEWSEL